MRKSYSAYYITVPIYWKTSEANHNRQYLGSDGCSYIMIKYDKRITICLSKKMLQQITKAATDHETSISGLLRRLFRAYLKQKRKDNKC